MRKSQAHFQEKLIFDKNDNFIDSKMEKIIPTNDVIDT